MLPEVDEASSSAAQLAPVDYCSHTNFSLGEVAACQAGFIQCFKDFSSCALRHYVRCRTRIDDMHKHIHSNRKFPVGW